MTATVAGIHLGIDTHANRPAGNTVPDGSIYSCSTHSLIYKSNYAGNSWATWASLTGTGFADPMTTRGDIIIRDAANSTSRLAIGSAGKVPLSDGTDLAYGFATGSKWTRGTSMPGSPATGERITRTDLSIDYEYNGTRWLSTQLLYQEIPINEVVMPFAANASVRSSIINGAFDIWMENWYADAFTGATNNGTNFWTWTLKKETMDAAYATSTIVSFDTSADTAGQFVHHTVAINALLGTSSGSFLASGIKTLSPGTAYCVSKVAYRLVGV